MSKHMEHERKLLAKRQMLEQDARKKYDELDEIFQQITETNVKIEEQRQKQQRKREPAILLRSDPTLVDRMREEEQ